VTHFVEFPQQNSKDSVLIKIDNIKTIEIRESTYDEGWYFLWVFMINGSHHKLQNITIAYAEEIALKLEGKE